MKNDRLFFTFKDLQLIKPVPYYNFTFYLNLDYYKHMYIILQSVKDQVSYPGLHPSGGLQWQQTLGLHYYN